MLNISTDNIHLNCIAKTKNEVLSIVSNNFNEKNYVSSDCLKYLQEREKQISTFLGNGIVLPHLPHSAKGIILKTSVEIFQFPQGVIWDRGKVMFIAIGVLAKDKEHIDILKNIASLLGDEIIANALALVSNKDDFIKILNRK